MGLKRPVLPQRIFDQRLVHCAFAGQMRAVQDEAVNLNRRQAKGIVRLDPLPDVFGQGHLQPGQGDMRFELSGFTLETCLDRRRFDTAMQIDQCRVVFNTGPD